MQALSSVEIIIPDSLEDICGIYFGGWGFEEICAINAYLDRQGKNASAKIGRTFVSISSKCCILSLTLTLNTPLQIMSIYGVPTRSDPNSKRQCWPVLSRNWA